MIVEFDLPSGAGTAIDRLTTAYLSGGAGASGTPEYEKFCTDLKPTATSEFLDLMNVSAYGDPEHWPGLTAPAVNALGAHLQATSDGGDADEDVIEQVLLHRARTTTFAIREYESSLERYERLAPVLKGLAALLHHLPANEHGAFAAWPMAEMLRTAPTQALAGPLQPLVQAFKKRIQDGKSSFEERAILEQISADQALSGQVEDSFRPVADAIEALRRRNSRKEQPQETETPSGQENG